MFSWQQVTGIVASFIGLVGFLPYINTTFQGKTRPNRATWWIWGSLGIIQGISYYYSGASNTIWLPILYAVCQIIIAILSIKFGEGGWNRFDRICLIGAGVSLLLWWWYDSPMVALLFALVIDAFGAFPTIAKSYYRPEEESSFSWTIFLIANTLNLIALERLSLELLAYPFYLFCLSGTMFTILVVPKIVVLADSKKAKVRKGKIYYKEKYFDG